MTDQKKLIGWLFGSLTGLAALIIVVMVAVILGNIAYFGLEKLSWGFLVNAPAHGMTEGGIFPAIFGTVALVVLMTIAVIPLGVATAVYMHEYAPKRSRVVRAVRVAIQARPDVILMLTDVEDLALGQFKPLLASVGKPIVICVAKVSSSAVGTPRALR